MVWLEIIVVLGAIFFGIRQGGIGIGLCGGLGLAILTLGFGLPMGSPPVDVILIIMTVVVAASALQAAGGMDYLVRVAGNFMRRNPKYINIIAPIITWSMTIMAGTGFIVFSTLPVIAEVANAKWHLNRSWFGITIDHDLACFRSLIGILPVTPGINSFHHSLHCRV